MADSLGIDKQVQNLLAEFGGERSEEVLKHFGGKFSVVDMFSYLWNIEEAHSTLTPEIPGSRKSKSESEKLRKDGNKAYEKKKLSEALKLYNKSILAAPHPPLETDDRDNEKDADQIQDEDDLGALPLAYANRSAVLYELKQYGDCLDDIERALKFGYPENLRHKLVKRREGCASALDTPEGQASEGLITRHSAKSPVLIESNPALPSLSSAVKVAFGPSVGRYLVALREIEPGEVLVVEEIYSRCLYHQNLQTHCTTCYTRCLIPLPCPSCKDVVFCSNSCRLRGLNGQHALECRILSVLGTMNTNMVVPFRILTKTPHQRLKNLLEHLHSGKESFSPLSLGFNEKGIYDPADYRTVYCLVTNQEKRDARSLFTLCAGAFMLTKLLLQCRRYFIDDAGNPVDPREEELMQVGGAFFHHIMSDLSNGHRYGELQTSGTNSDLDIQNIGAWISPTISLANHSCDQAVITCNKGNLGVMTAIQVIQPGQEVTTGYLRGYGTQNISLRREILTKYYLFDCVCRACQGNWPTFGSLPDNYQMKCLECAHFINRSDNLCSSCGLDYSTDGNSTYNWRRIDQEVGLAILGFLRMRKIFKMDSFETRYEDLRATTRVIEIMDKYVLLPNKIYANAKVFLARLLSNQRDYVKVKAGF